MAGALQRSRDVDYATIHTLGYLPLSQGLQQLLGLFSRVLKGRVLLVHLVLVWSSQAAGAAELSASLCLRCSLSKYWLHQCHLGSEDVV